MEKKQLNKMIKIIIISYLILLFDLKINWKSDSLNFDFKYQGLIWSYLNKEKMIQWEIT